MESERTNDPPDESARITWEGLLRELESSIPDLVSDFMWEVQARDIYANYEVPQRDLVETAHESLALQVRRLMGEPDSPGTAQRLSRLVSRRLAQGVPLASFLRANRLDFRVLWQRLESIAGREGAVVIAGNVTKVLDTVEKYIDELRSHYQSQELHNGGGVGAQRHRAIAQLFSGEEHSSIDIELIADRLQVAPDGMFEVIAVVGDAIGAQLERYGNDDAVGIFETARSAILFREQKASCAWPDEAIGSGGYVGEVAGLSQIPSAAISALAIARHAPRHRVQFFTAEEVWALVAHRHLEQVLPRHSRSIRDALAAESEHDRELIIEATSEYFRSGSIKLTSERLFCHRNTVIKRLRYFTQATGFDPTVPKDAAWIYIVLQGLAHSNRVQLHSSRY